MSIKRKPHTFSLGAVHSSESGEYYANRCNLYIPGETIEIYLIIEGYGNQTKFYIPDAEKTRINRFMYNNRKLD